ncbi:MAG TPA: sigma-70 family RNA polymerase sigma factor [Polyangiaceae bacterium]
MPSFEPAPGHRDHQQGGRTARESGIFLRAPHLPPRTELPQASLKTSVEERTDEELIAGMIGNRPWAWKEFQRRYDRLIHRCITKVTRRFSAKVGADDVRDIYSSLYLALVANDRHKLRTFDPARGNRFSSWIGLLAINCAYDYLRALKREPCRASLAEAVEQACVEPNPYEHAVESERAAIAARILDGFSAKDRTFATLYFGEELDPVEIAARMNISVKTVYSKKHKIQSRLESFVAGTDSPAEEASSSEAA